MNKLSRYLKQVIGCKCLKPDALYKIAILWWIALHSNARVLNYNQIIGFEIHNLCYEDF